VDYCDYDVSRGYVRHDGLGCFKGETRHKVHILYNACGDRETVVVCDECYQALIRNCRRHGYRLVEEGYV
jgi:hypothetical protein